ncbi:hypothetical protein [Ponticaulis sp.]|uniref:hypothetical protein n=1 Tax=Ponticaulis sp. TaxID=2020902 RepID=UPI000B62D650|nr:hypothetical protein [Ponticaulis sp.]MAJ07468.1 hypothetical protein [Ponticaulis sp.]HBJ93907.1 hypothetical protein [Hyphomonadaceae bacterium]|tara:strand:+ start:130 stop:582 length:453 start_codon:yes stop_codon:yes gene_type:complete
MTSLKRSEQLHRLKNVRKVIELDRLSKMGRARSEADVSRQVFAKCSDDLTHAYESWQSYFEGNSDPRIAQIFSNRFAVQSNVTADAKEDLVQSEREETFAEDQFSSEKALVSTLEKQTARARKDEARKLEIRRIAQAEDLRLARWVPSFD